MKTKTKKPNVTQWLVPVRGEKRPLSIAATSQEEAESIAKRDGYRVNKSAGHPPAPGTNGKSPKPSPSTTSPPPKASGNTPPSPVAETKTPNGSAPGKTYYRYLFHADSGMATDSADLEYLPACAKDLASRSFANFGDAYMGVYAKFVGVRNVEQVDLRWRCNTFRLDVIVTLAGEDPKTIGWLEPSSDEWYTNQPDGTRTEHKPAPPPRALPAPPDPALLKAAAPKPDEFTAADLPKPKPPKKVAFPSVETDKATGKQRVFGESPTAIMRWCGYDAWTIQDVAYLFIGLGLADSIKKETVEKQMTYGRKGPNGSPHPIPKFAPEQEDALLKLAERTKLKNAPAKKNPSKK